MSPIPMIGAGRRGWLIDLACLAVAGAAALFYRLGALPIMLWDESRLANNALEMSRGQLRLVTTYLGQPDLWNTKPPLMPWLMAICMKLFGPAEWALRLPAVLAAMLTAWVVYAFCRSVTGSRRIGLCGSLVLLSTCGYVAPHVARTADYDALLILFTSVFTLGGYFVIHALRSGQEPNSALLLVASVSLAGGILTKGVAGLLMVPGIVVAAGAMGAVRPGLKNGRLIVALLAPLVLAACFYLVREAASPGYLKAVWNNEIGGRFATTVEGHGGPVRYYLSQLVTFWPSHGEDPILASAAPWSWLIPVAAALGLLKPGCRPAVIYLLIVGTCFAVLISVARTKIPWYVAPLYPLIASLVAIAVGSALQDLLSRRWPRWGAMPGSLALFGPAALLLSAGIVYRNSELVAQARTRPDFASPAFIKDLSPSLRPGDKLRIVHGTPGEPADPTLMQSAYAPQELFYAQVLRQNGVDARIVRTDYTPARGDKLMWCDLGRDWIPERPLGRVILARPPCSLTAVSPQP